MERWCIGRSVARNFRRQSRKDIRRCSGITESW
jgi:hypothetical protein